MEIHQVFVIAVTRHRSVSNERALFHHGFLKQPHRGR